MTGSRHGAIIVGGKGGDNSKSVSISKTGFGTEIAGDGAPKMPFLVPQALLDALTSELSPKSGDDDSGGDKSDSSGDGSSDSSGDGQGDSEGSASEQAGQDAVDTGGDLDGAGSLGDLGADMGNETTLAVQDQGDGNNGEVRGLISKFQELDVLSAAGIMGHYDASGDLFDSSQVDRGDFSFHMMIDFGQKKICIRWIDFFYNLNLRKFIPKKFSLNFNFFHPIFFTLYLLK